MNNLYPASSAEYFSGLPTRTLPQPPRLHWGFVLVLSALTMGIFGAIWMLVLGIWARRVHRRGYAYILAICYVSLFPAGFVMGFMGALLLGVNTEACETFVHLLDPIVRIASLVLYLCTAYMLRSELEAEPISLSLSPIMTFFFAPVYFQYFLRDWDQQGSSGTVTLNLSQRSAADAKGKSTARFAFKGNVVLQTMYSSPCKRI